MRKRRRIPPLVANLRLRPCVMRKIREAEGNGREKLEIIGQEEVPRRETGDVDGEVASTFTTRIRPTSSAPLT